MIAPVGRGGHEEELVGLRESIEEQRRKLRDTEWHIEETDVPKVPDLRASRETQPRTPA